MATDQPPFKVKAIYDYPSGHYDDLVFNAEQIITVTAIEDDDWYFGEYKDAATGEAREGIFPMNFVEKVKVEVPARPARSSRLRKEAAETEPEAVRPPTPPKEEQPPPPPVQRSLPPPAAPVPKPAPVVIEHRLPPPPVEEPKPAPKSAPMDDAKSPVSPKPGLAKPSNKPPPPDKPSSSSFRDRLALFNKVGGVAPAPFQPNKPRGDFIKKPFVPPPPSKNSYIPPPTPHAPKPKRDEETVPALAPPPEPSARASGEIEREAEEEGPKQSLKERIAMLQRQQMNPAAIPGEKPKRPPKPKRAPSVKSQVDEQAAPELAPPETPEVERPRKSVDGQPDRGLDVEEEVPPVKPKRSVEIRREDIPAEDSSAGEADGSSASAEPRPERTRRAPAPAHQSDFGDDEGANDTPDPAESEEDEEDEEVDPEVARKIALRERMMKMSGGMGMHGVFGAPMGIPPPVKKKAPKSVTEEDKPRKSSEGGEERSPEPHQAPVPMIPVFPMMPKGNPPLQVEHEPEEEEPEGVQAAPGGRISEERTRDVPVDIEDMRPASSGRPTSSGKLTGPRPMPTGPRSPPLVPEEHDLPAPPPPPLTDRPVPPPPPTAESRPPPPQPPRTPSEGSLSEDEMSQRDVKVSVNVFPTEQPRTLPPPPPPLGIPPSISGRPGPSGEAMSPTSPQSKRQSQGYFSPMSPSTASPISPNLGPINKRASYQKGTGIAPPIPAGITSSVVVTRAPPPPPPGSAAPLPPPRHSLDEARTPERRSDTEEEVTEYEADYDTDIGNKVAHRDALTAQHGKGHDRDEDEDTPLPSPTITPPHIPSRAVPPPPPPTSLPPPARQSTDMPRAPPPLPPPGPSTSQPRHDTEDDGDDEYDPYKYDSPATYNSPPPPPGGPYAPPLPPLSQAPPPPTSTERQQPRGNVRQSMDTMRGPPPQPRQSMEATRGAPSGRRSMDQSRPHIPDYIAREIDLGHDSQWWTNPNTLPPVYAARLKDLIFEIEESTSSRRGGRTTITKDVYILFHDYSQTVLCARYDRDDPASATLEQRHEAPPPQLRQDQLEDFQSQLGAKIFAGVKQRENTVVGDGEPHTLIAELFSLVPAALRPVGTRAFGALVYANLANASVQQFDEIRAGDIITFRNAKFQGHKGGLHQKYAAEVGKPDHVAIVVDWDGTKKKIRAYEQGRESKKVKIDSFKVGDLRSGEVKVWRVAARSWVGWDNQG